MTKTLYVPEHVKKEIEKNKTEVKNFIKAHNKKAIDVLGDFLYNYLEMKGETELYTKFMEEKIDGFLKESGQGDSEVSREPIQKEKE